MPYFSSITERIVGGIRSALHWLKPGAVREEINDFHIRNLAYDLRHHHKLFGTLHHTDLEDKIKLLVSARESNSKFYEFGRYMLMVPTSAAYLIPTHMQTGNYLQEPRQLFYFLTAAVTGYVIGTIFGKIGKTAFENKTREELSMRIDAWKERPKEDEEESEYLETPYRPPEFEFTQEQTPPAIKPRANKIKNYDEPKPQTDLPLPKQIKWEELERDINNYKL